MAVITVNDEMYQISRSRLLRKIDQNTVEDGRTSVGGRTFPRDVQVDNNSLIVFHFAEKLWRARSDILEGRGRRGQGCACAAHFLRRLQRVGGEVAWTQVACTVKMCRSRWVGRGQDPREAVDRASLMR